LVYPLPEGAPVPPELESPHALIDPSALRAAKAKKFEAILVYPISEGAPVPETPHALIDPSALKADGSITAWGHSNLGGTTPASIDWIVPTKVVSYPMNGDISVDIEPIHRTTGHKSAAFV
jgi:hypothetical protein